MKLFHGTPDIKHILFDIKLWTRYCNTWIATLQIRYPGKDLNTTQTQHSLNSTVHKQYSGDVTCECNGDGEHSASLYEQDSFEVDVEHHLETTSADEVQVIELDEHQMICQT